MRGTWSLFFRGNAADMERLSAGVDGLADDVRYQSIWTSWKNAEFRYSDGIVTRIASEYRTGAIDGIREVMEVFHQYAPQTEAACRLLAGDAGREFCAVRYISPGLPHAISIKTRPVFEWTDGDYDEEVEFDVVWLVTRSGAPFACKVEKGYGFILETWSNWG